MVTVTLTRETVLGLSDRLGLGPGLRRFRGSECRVLLWAEKLSELQAGLRGRPGTSHGPGSSEIAKQQFCF